ncbi:MAG: radical SAM protein [Candidatus Saganbacteria bacterium]|nr:radical SAM protein [Candidatus Saganbacteria bacterium]
MHGIFEEILPLVRKPSRYIGNELNSIHKNWDDVSLHIALAYPDLYEVGMSNLGIQILYDILNKQKDVLAERVFCPAPDMAEKLKEQVSNLSLLSLESWTPISKFDMLGFSIGHELTYTNILEMLKLSNIPIYSKDRDDSHPIIFAGGPACFNPEPIAEFVDFFVIGEAEEAIVEIGVRVQGIGDRVGKLKELAKIEGVYVPAMKNRVKKRHVADFSNAHVPIKPIVPFIQTIQDRAVVEVMRGCKRACKFCNARVLYSPVRERDPKRVISLADELIKNTGQEKLALTSLSSSDYSAIESVSKEIAQKIAKQKVSLNLPSLRTDSFGVRLAKEVSRVRPSSLTLAPETGNEKLRFSIGKRITDQEVLEGVKAAFEGGISAVKLYFMIGLPGETDDDILSIAELVKKAHQIGRSFTKRVRITAALSTYVPKPHTAFEREAQIGISETLRRQKIIKDNTRQKGIEVRWHQAETSFLEGVFTRGDRELSRVIVAAWKLGAKLDAWSEYFKFDIWQKAFAECKIDPNSYLRKRSPEEELPWNFISIN